MKYRIDVINQEGKPDLFQPQCGQFNEILDEEIWWNLINISGIIHTNGIEHQYWDTEAEAREVIELHKKQSEPKITHTYIEVI